jgi:hypothetical protein
MAPHQQRVIDEHQELTDKLDKLNSFFSNPVFQGLDAAEQDRMRRQASAMQEYADVLVERINAFN